MKLLALAAVANLLFPAPTAPSPVNRAKEPGVVITRDGHAHLYLVGEINNESVRELVTQIVQANARQAVQIDMFINSPGGSVMSGIVLAQIMEESPAPIVCTVDGMAASMAFYVLQSCSVRQMTKRSVLMAHEPWVGSDGPLTRSGAEETAAQLKAITKMIVEHCAARMSISVAELLHRIDNKNWWIEWEEAVKVGAVDKVLDPPNKALKR